MNDEQKKLEYSQSEEDKAAMVAETGYPRVQPPGWSTWTTEERQNWLMDATAEVVTACREMAAALTRLNERMIDHDRAIGKLSESVLTAVQLYHAAAVGREPRGPLHGKN
ncbi:MAG: hypothetical protein IPM24_02235 [Bryobacterales bacterium]|nr:hypothetical protein [Bryobacterales bacterium]